MTGPNHRGSTPSIEWFHHRGIAYVILPVDGAVPIRSKHFRTWVRAMALRQGIQLTETSFNQRIADLEALALHGDCTERELFTRVGRDDDHLYVDLMDGGQVVEISSGRWTVTTAPHCVFSRPRSAHSLPIPEDGGSLVLLRELLNIDDEDSWLLIVGFLLTAMRPMQPLFHLGLVGIQGAAKSTLAMLLQSTIDPHVGVLRSPPTATRDLMIAAQHCWMLCFDNTSSISAEISDALCRMSTGGSYSHRTLRTDGDEYLITAWRPCILTSIEDVVTRADLIDRTLVVEVPVIKAHRRKAQGMILAEFRRRHPEILGALIRAASTALAQVDHVRLETLPRMADAATWVEAAAPEIGWRQGAFIAALSRNANRARIDALDESSIAEPIVHLTRLCGEWIGTCQQLLPELSARSHRRAGWPATPKALSNMLRRLAPSLLDVGVEVDFSIVRTGRGGRRLGLRWIGSEAPPLALVRLA